MSIGGWSILGIASAVLIAAGIVLLVVYAAQRGLVHRALDGVVATETAPVAVPAPLGVQARDRGRTLGAVGAAMLAVGLVLGLLTALLGWGGAGSTSDTGPGAAPVDCAQSWSGCPQATPGP